MLNAQQKYIPFDEQSSVPSWIKSTSLAGCNDDLICHSKYVLSQDSVRDNAKPAKAVKHLSVVKQDSDDMDATDLFGSDADVEIDGFEAPEVDADMDEAEAIVEPPSTVGESPALDHIAAVFEKAKAKGDADRSAEAATILQEHLVQFDKNHFLGFHGSNLFVFKKAEQDGRKTLTRMTKAAFNDFYSNITIPEKDQSGNTRAKPVAPIWLKTTPRRYENIVFDPSGQHKQGEYNLWGDFGVKPERYDPYKIKILTNDLILNQLCAGNEANADYLIKWMAHGVQHPATKPGVAIVLRGKQGTGKSTLGNKLWVPIWGGHGITMSNSRHLTGNFNAHMRTSVGVFSDEAQYVGDHQGTQALKALITEDYGIHEAKGIDADLQRNYVKVIMATNSEWAVNATADARRFFVLDVSEKMAGVRTEETQKFWAQINHYIANGGVAQFLDYLLKVDLTGFNPAVFPDTEGLKKQREYSLDPTTRTVVKAVLAGRFSIGGSSFTKTGLEITKNDMHDSVNSLCKELGIHSSKWPSREAISKKLKDLGVLTTRAKDAQRTRSYVFPPIDDLERNIIEANKLSADYFDDGESD